MKCSLCDGKGKYINGLGVVSRCYYCLGTGEVNDKCERNMTNEEWFCGLPTTKKSEFMAKMVNEAIEVHEKHGATWHESTIWWDGWLKQPHKPIS